MDKRFSVVNILINLRIFIALIVVFAVFSIAVPNFRNPGTLVILVKHVAINALLTIGMTYVILTGGIDLSVGAVVGLIGMIAGGLIYEGVKIEAFGYILYFNVWAVMAIAVVIGAAIGYVNGFLITKFNIAPFIVTLGMMYIARGAAMLRSGGRTFPNLTGSPAHHNTGFPLLGAGTFLRIPYSIWIMIVVSAFLIYIARKTPFGRHVYAVGGNEIAARLSGVNVVRVKRMVYVISGVMSAVVGLIVSSQLVAAHPATGEAFEMDAIAASVLGGTSLAGGRGSIGGAIIGAFVIGIMNDGMVMRGVSSFWQMVIKGVVIIAAVIVDQFQSEFQRRAALSA
ncbi:MAG: ABC transporter permease [Synergistaceae bacterium]|jgi:erythritol transport system permease protein|nr:ABC transporter permease [Synergistaceae bacterium]